MSEPKKDPISKALGSVFRNQDVIQGRQKDLEAYARVNEMQRSEIVRNRALGQQHAAIGDAARTLGGIRQNSVWAESRVTSPDVQATIKKALEAWREGGHSFAVESLSVISQALDGLTQENESLREDRNHLRSENQRLREVNLRLQEQILKRLEE